MKKQITLTLLFLAAVLVSVSAVNAATLNVGSGQTYSNIQDAYDAANNSDTIFIKNGTYTGTGNTNIDLYKNLTIIGESQNGTIIDAETYDYIFYIGDGFNVTISKLTLKNGVNSCGGAIYNDGTCNVNKCTFTGNYAEDNGGGAIYNDGKMTVSACTFTDNDAYYSGGAIYNDGDGNLTVTNCNFIDNEAIGSDGGAIRNWGNCTVTGSTFTNNSGSNCCGGGAIENEGIMAITGCTFTGNTDDAYGGAVYNADIMTITGCTFTNNTAYYYGGAIYNYEDCILNITACNFTNNGDDDIEYGGAIYNDYGTMTITGSKFTGNYAADYGGAICSYAGNMTIAGSTFTGNDAYEDGGAIYNYYGDITVTDSTFTNNEACDGGAIYNYYSDMNVTGCTFTGNKAIDCCGGGAIYNDYGTMNITGSNFTSNYADYDGGAIYNSGPCNITNCTFTGNEAYYNEEYVDEYGGGAIHNEDDLTIIDSKFIDNTATGCSGGAIYACCEDITLLRCIFEGNTADYGGALYDYGNSINITGCNFNKNTAEYGGAIYCDQYLIIKYSRFVGNTAEELGQDIYMYNAGYPSDARYNWWGDNNGPAEGRIMTGKTSADSEIYGPWLVMNIDADPSTIFTGNNSKITANVYMDSNGTNHSADASQFFSGPEVTFTTNLGNVGSKSVTVDWILGTATAILRGDEGPGTASLTATDGSQTENTTVTILQSPEVNAASTVGMQNTGFPMAGLLLAILAVFGGLVGARKTN